MLDFVHSGLPSNDVDSYTTCVADPSYWNVLPWLDDVIADQELENVADTPVVTSE